MSHKRSIPQGDPIAAKLIEAAANLTGSSPTAVMSSKGARSGPVHRARRVAMLAMWIYFDNAAGVARYFAISHPDSVWKIVNGAETAEREDARLIVGEIRRQTGAGPRALVRTSRAPQKWSPVTAKILAYAAKRFQVPASKIQSGERSRHVYHARRFAWLVMRSMGLSYPEIGRLTGNDHSTVLTALQRHAEEEGAAEEQAEAHALALTLGADPERQRRELLFRENCQRWRELCAEDTKERVKA